MSISVHLKHGSGLSVRDKFGWLSIEGVDVPYILREAKEKFIPVRVVEGSILSYYPSTYPKEIEERPPLVCHYMKPEEITLLNKCCKQQGVAEQFTSPDPVVKLSDFLDFFGIVKEAYPDVVVGRRTPPVGIPDYGWILVKDALVPYVIRDGSRMAPLNVIRGAAQLLTGVHVTSACATETEIACLNDMCRKVGLVFTFQKNTSLVDLVLVFQMCPDCPMQDLPKENPMDFVNAVASTTAVGTEQLDSLVTPGSSRSSMLDGAIPASKESCLDSHQHSATRSLQALAKIAHNHIQKPGEADSTQEDEDCVMISQPEKTLLKIPQPPRRHTSSAINGLTAKVIARCQPSHTLTTSAVTIETKETISQSKQTIASKASKPPSSVVIKPMECFGKTISCLLRGKTGVAYALVEAVCRVYFPSSSLVDFIHFLELEMAVTLYVLKRVEEEAFIQFYGIPTKQLRCNQVIKLQDLRDRMGWLQTRFGSPKSRSPSIGQASNGDQSSGGDPDSKGMDSLGGSDISSGEDGPLKVSNGADKTNGETDHEDTANGQDIPNGDVFANGEEFTNRELKVRSRENSAVDDHGPNGKNKNLESTIMRILQDKRDSREQVEIKGQEMLMEEADTVAHCYHELNKETGGHAGSQGNEAGDQHRTPSSHKRKGAPPRKCLVPREKKITPDCVKSENYTEESDMEDYV